MKRIFSFSILALISLFISVPGFTQGRKKIPSEKPRLIVGIVISQMRTDYIHRYWNKFGDDGFKKLISGGTYCRNNRFNYLFSQEGVGQATIATGTNPSNHGIVSQEWYVSLLDKIVSSTEDPDVKTVGAGYDAGKRSPSKLMSTTYSDELRLSDNFKSKVFSVSLTPQGSVFSGGHTANGAYWFDAVSGNWITSTYYMDSLPAWVNDFNAKKLPDIYMEKEWNTLLPIGQYTESLPDNNKYEKGIKGDVTFPYDLMSLSKSTRKEKNYGILKSTPYGNDLIKDFALSLIANDSLGKDDYPDVITIGFDATEAIGKQFGPNSVEMEDAFIRLDQELAHLLSFIDEQVGKENALVFLTSEHGLAEVPDYLIDKKIPAGYFNYMGAISLLGSYLNVVYGSGEWIKSYHAQQIYLNHNLIEDAKIPLADIQNKVAQFMLQFSGVANSVTATTLETANFTNGIFANIQNGFNQKRSGDVIINLKSGWVEKNEGSTNSTSGYSYDTRVPLIWYGWKIGRGTILEPTDLIDIAPTICTFLEIAYPNASTGNPIISLMR